MQQPSVSLIALITGAILALILIRPSLALARSNAGGQGGEQVQPESGPEPYSFSYQSESQGGASMHQESGDGQGKVTGFYMLMGDDGRERRVDYVADENGYRASISSNEIGMRSESSADAQMNIRSPSEGQLSQAKVSLDEYNQLEQLHQDELNRHQQQQQQQLKAPSSASGGSSSSSGASSQQSSGRWTASSSGSAGNSGQQSAVSFSNQDSSSSWRQQQQQQQSSGNQQDSGASNVTVSEQPADDNSWRQRSELNNQQSVVKQQANQRQRQAAGSTATTSTGWSASRSSQGSVGPAANFQPTSNPFQSAAWRQSNAGQQQEAGSIKLTGGSIASEPVAQAPAVVQHQQAQQAAWQLANRGGSLPARLAAAANQAPQATQMQRQIEQQFMQQAFQLTDQDYPRRPTGGQQQQANSQQVAVQRQDQQQAGANQFVAEGAQFSQSNEQQNNVVDEIVNEQVAPQQQQPQPQSQPQQQQFVQIAPASQSFGQQKMTTSTTSTTTAGGQFGQSQDKVTGSQFIQPEAKTTPTTTAIIMTTTTTTTKVPEASTEGPSSTPLAPSGFLSINLQNQDQEEVDEDTGKQQTGGGSGFVEFSQTSKQSAGNQGNSFNVATMKQVSETDQQQQQVGVSSTSELDESSKFTSTTKPIRTTPVATTTTTTLSPQTTTTTTSIPIQTTTTVAQTTTTAGESTTTTTATSGEKTVVVNEAQDIEDTTSSEAPGLMLLIPNKATTTEPAQTVKYTYETSTTEAPTTTTTTTAQRVQEQQRPIVVKQQQQQQVKNNFGVKEGSTSGSSGFNWQRQAVTKLTDGSRARPSAAPVSSAQTSAVTATRFVANQRTDSADLSRLNQQQQPQQQYQSAQVVFEAKQSQQQPPIRFVPAVNYQRPVERPVGQINSSAYNATTSQQRRVISGQSSQSLTVASVDNKFQQQGVKGASSRGPTTSRAQFWQKNQRQAQELPQQQQQQPATINSRERRTLINSNSGLTKVQGFEGASVDYANSFGSRISATGR